ncbi:Cytochrome c peroxidase [Burkholderia sp. 8Y]|uniref:cytochrome-c peroxidase n=1 Tax=Burkholderia sp. 8Y TaxID=2653133 RepID=UPI0012F22168|nr:cytochrome c peroxidase [Burkholderia sp. 8Y]VXB33942.1 Cytochrome c peroxidase [Burkholderia sp. 8Y]
MSTIVDPALGPPSDKPGATRRVLRVAAALVVAAGAFAAYAVVAPSRVPAAIGDIVENLTGANAHPVVLQRPPTVELSAVAQLGKHIFFDRSLSASGQQSCASCHDPAHAFGPPNDLAVQQGGPHLTLPGYRPPPSLMYLYRQPAFSIGPDQGDADEAPDLAKLAARASGTARAQKNAGVAPAAPAMVPQGGLFWDGRADTLQAQASGPMVNPVEMANTSLAQVAEKLAHTAYKADFEKLFGPRIFHSGDLAVSEAMFAVARYQVEEQAFHPYTSKFDYWLEGKARLTQAELHGLRLFNDPDKANCAGCHLSKPSPDGLPPMFTDFQYESLGVPRNYALAINRNPKFYDMGVCGPFREDLRGETQYCGMFLTPTLRNVATRHAFFHNGIYRSLDDVMAFYNERNTAPQKFYPKDGKGEVRKYDDLPPQFRANVDGKDAPFDRKLGDTPAMTQADIHDIVAFLKTLNDGYKP